MKKPIKKRIKKFNNKLILMVVFLAIVTSIIILQRLTKSDNPKNTSNTPETSSQEASNLNNTDNQPKSNTQSSNVFSDKFSGKDGIYLNEYSYDDNKCGYKSDNWVMNSGTLLLKNNVGYSGVPTEEDDAICNSKTKNNSAVFRLYTAKDNFSNVKVSLDYMPIAKGKAKSNSYDGMHMWVGYQNEESLYAVTFFRWDKTLVIKKKTPINKSSCSEVSNGGCYFNLGESVNKYSNLQSAKSWHHVDVYYKTVEDKVSIIYEIDGTKILDVTDPNKNGSLYKSGAVGIRADNTEFNIKNFEVTNL